MRLFRAELNRLRSRRLVIATLLAILATVGGVLVFAETEARPLPADEQAAIQAEYDRALEGWKEACEENPKPGEQCDQPTMGGFGGPATFQETGEATVTLLVSVLGFAFFLVGASSIGAEYSCGSIGTWVSHLPKRGRVFWSKAAALAFTAWLASTVAVSLLIAGLVPIYYHHNLEVSGAGTLITLGLRGTLIPIALATIGFAVALLTRATAAAIGVLAGYGLLWIVRSSVMPMQWQERVTQWSPEGNAQAILKGGYEYMQPIEHLVDGEIIYDFIPHQVSLAQGLTYWSVLLIVVAGISLIVFRYRDLA